MRDDGITPMMPDNPAGYLTDWLMEIGPVVSAGMGSAPIGWRDIAAWSGLTGIPLYPWQARLLRRLSAEYLTQSLEAAKPDCPAPFVSSERTEAARVAVGDKLAAALRARTGNRTDEPTRRNA